MGIRGALFQRYLRVTAYGFKELGLRGVFRLRVAVVVNHVA